VARASDRWDPGGAETLAARSRRRSAGRRRRSPPPSRRFVRGFLIAAAAFALAGGIVAEAQTPARVSGERSADVSRSARCPVPSAYRPAFVAAAREHRLPVGLLVAMAHEESGMNPAARSPKGAIGVLQLMPGTAGELGANPAVPRENVRAGARYLSQLVARFGNLDLALAAYNAGPTAVARAGGAPSVETLRYVLDVRSRAASLVACG
jgi:soluble lytic murein transglycosylase-like protein